MASSENQKAEDKLREKNLQVTAQRIAIVEAVTHHPHAKAEDILKVVRSEIGSISKQAVYDSLAVLTEVGLIRRIQPSGSPARFEDRVGDNHHHLICRSCSVMFDVDCAVGAAPCLNASENYGFKIDEAEVIYWGHCPECTAALAEKTDQKSPSETN